LFKKIKEKNPNPSISFFMSVEMISTGFYH